MATHGPHFGNSPPPPSPFRGVIVAIKLCNKISTFAEGKQSAWVPQRVLVRTVVLERSISPPYTQEFIAIQIFVRRHFFENLYNTKSRLYGIQATRNYDALLFALVDRSVSFLVRFLPLFCIEKCY